MIDKYINSLDSIIETITDDQNLVINGANQILEPDPTKRLAIVNDRVTELDRVKAHIEAVKTNLLANFKLTLKDGDTTRNH